MDHSVGFDEVFTLPGGKKLLISSCDGIVDAYIQLNLGEIEKLKGEVEEWINEYFKNKEYVSLEQMSGAMACLQEVQTSKMNQLLPPPNELG